MNIQWAGEYYVLSCPFCNDTRGRLWVNHRWGVYDQGTRTRNLWLAVCYNEHCLGTFDRRTQLMEMLTMYYRRVQRGEVTVRPGTAPPRRPEINLPTDFVSLDQLPARHQAVQYVQGRGFDPQMLARRWGVGFSHYACNWSSAGRLLIPVYDQPFSFSEVALAGWQARALVEDDEPKYYSAYGMRRSEVLYGRHPENQSGPIIICEGPTDAWRIGRNALALLGKSLSHEQRSRLTVGDRYRGRPIVIMLDSDASDDAAKIHERISAARRNTYFEPDDSPVVMAQLPAGKDPADCTPVELREAIQAALRGAAPIRRAEQEGA